MTISQPSTPVGSGPLAIARWRRTLEALARWQRRRSARAELARLAQAGDHLLRDIGLDPALARTNPDAVLEHLLEGRCPP